MMKPIPHALILVFAAALFPGSSVRAQTGSTRYTLTTVADNTATGTTFDHFSDAFPAINDNGVVAFRATLKDGTQVLYSSINGALTPLATTADTSGLFTSFNDNSVAINHSGTIVFSGNTTVGGTGTPAIFTVNQGGGAAVPIVTGASDPVDFGDQLQSAAINDAGTIVFEAKGTENPFTGDHIGGYYQVDPGDSTPTALYANGNNGSLFPPTINQAGQVAFILDPGVPQFSGDTDPGQQVWRIDAPGFAPNVLAAVGGTISSFVDTSGLTATTDVVDIDEVGVVVYNARLTDGTDGIFISRSAGDMETFLTTGASGFQTLVNVAYGASGAVVFYGTTANGGGTFDGPDPINGQILSDPYRGGNFTQLSGVSHNQINASGQFVFTYSLDNGINGIAVATPNGTVSPTPTPSPTGTPVVTIGPATAKTYENGGKLKFVVSRIGDASAALTVAYSVKGSAKSGSNFKPLPGTVVIPAGSASALLKIKTKDDHVIDGTHVLKLTLLPGDGYTVGAAAKVKLKILDAD